MAEQNVFMTAMTYGANLTEKAVGVPLVTARAIRDEFFRATFAYIDWLEGLNQSPFKVAREALKGVDKLSHEALDSLDAMAGSVVRVLRGSGEAAGEMVSKTAASLTEKGAEPKPVAVRSA